MSNWSRIVNVFRGGQVDREIDEELASHLAEAVEQGRDPREARRAFGSALREREASRDVRVAVWLDSLRADFVFGWRQLWKNKASSVAAVLSLGLAMGACLAAFRLIDALMYRPLPVKDPGGLYYLAFPYVDDSGKNQLNDTFDYPQFRMLRAAVQDQAELMAISSPDRHGLTFGSDDEAEKFWQQSVSGWTFDSLGLKPAVGRLLTAADDAKPGANAVAVLSYDYWTRRFGRDPKVVGRTFHYGKLYEIVGVCEKGFTGTEPGRVTDLFIPTMMNAQAIDNPHWGWFRTWLRVKPGGSLEVAQQKLRAGAAAYRREEVKSWDASNSQADREQYLRAELRVEPAASGVSDMQREYRLALAVLAAVVVLVLLIACANVANLMTAQAAARCREMALRVSIGAGRLRLVQLVLIEGVIVAMCATVVAAVFAWWAAPFVVNRINPPHEPARLVLDADWRVLVFSGALALAVTVLFALIPAVRASSVKPMSALKGGEDPHSRRRLMNGLVAAQVAFCVLVCFVCGLLVTTSNRLTQQPTGFVADRVLTLETSTKGNVPSVEWETVRRLLQNVEGVESVAVSGWALMGSVQWTENVRVDGRGWDTQGVYLLRASQDWLGTMSIPLLDGRDIRSTDGPDGTAIVNQAFARRFFDGQNPVGRTFETMVERKPVRTLITGYVADARYSGMREAIRPTVYRPLDNVKGVDWATFIVRTKSQNPLALASILKREIQRAQPLFRVANIRTQQDLIDQHTLRERLLAMLSMFFASVALVLAGIGLYGVLSYSVLQRRREIGIRMALGARSGSIAWRVGWEVLPMILAGAAAGLVAGAGAQRYLEALLYEVKAGDPVMLAAPAATIVLVALLAALPPVVRALRIDPAVTLRAE